MTKILITGASGLLGRKVLSYFQSELKNKWTCLGLCFSRNKNPNLKCCDLTDFNQINCLIEEFKVCVLSIFFFFLNSKVYFSQMSLFIVLLKEKLM